MKINRLNNIKQKSFSALKLGEVFIWDDKIYMKTTPIEIGNTKVVLNAVDLSSGYFETLNGSDMVILMNAELNVKGE